MTTAAFQDSAVGKICKLEANVGRQGAMATAGAHAYDWNEED